jgi:parallel beta-helix repeat protein
VVGCGAATNNRPRIIPPATETTGRGIRAFGVDGLLFQSLGTFAQANDGIFVQGADGVTFRDIVGDGNFVSRYAVFPIQSEDILIELCNIKAVADAGLYVGQSGKTVLRHNEVRTSVASIEFENTVNGIAYGNYAFDNTAGMLIFKDNNLIDQSSCHDVHHNLFESNNRVNIGVGTVAGVPDGAGILVIANDSSLIHHNILRDHRTWGFAQVDQALAGFTPVDPDSQPDNEFFYNNQVTDNGYDFHPLGLFGADIVNINAGVGNCGANNIFDVQVGNFQAAPCVLPPPAFAACPAPFTIP